jgi:hypothetical protein
MPRRHRDALVEFLYEKCQTGFVVIAQGQFEQEKKSKSSDYFSLSIRNYTTNLHPLSCGK